MKILSCVAYRYYENNNASYEYISFVECLRALGNIVHHFDYRQQAVVNREAMNDFFVSVVKDGKYDLVLIVTNRDQFMVEALEEAKKCSALVAWNCDDDWRWDTYSSKWVTHYTYMVTTYRYIYEANKTKYPNLLLSQWGCTGIFDGLNVEKNINVSFVGGGHGKRQDKIEFLRKELGMVAFGRGIRDPKALKKYDPGTWKTKLKRFIAQSFRIPMQEKDKELETQEAVKNIWNRSRISFTPLEASTGGGLQIKARVFDMGLSATLMLCNRNEALYEFYEPQKEFVEFENMNDCVEKARFYLKHESERRKIAEAYYKRTKGEHLWQHRFEKLFREIGLY